MFKSEHSLLPLRKIYILIQNTVSIGFSETSSDLMLCLNAMQSRLSFTMGKEHQMSLRNFITAVVTTNLISSFVVLCFFMKIKKSFDFLL